METLIYTKSAIVQNEFVSFCDEERMEVFDKGKKKIAFLKENISSLKEQIELLENVILNPEDLIAFLKKVTSRISQSAELIFEQEMKSIHERHLEEVRMNRMLLENMQNRIMAQRSYASMILDCMDQKLKSVISAKSNNSVPILYEKGLDSIEETDMDLDDIIKAIKNDIYTKSNKNEKAEKKNSIENVLLNIREKDTTDIETMNENARQAQDETENGSMASVGKYAYIINKVAGDDLYDNSGKLIIAKNEYITEKIIHKAEVEGKFVALVVNMKLRPDYES